MKTLMLILIGLSMVACSKKPDAPAPEATVIAPTNPPSGTTPPTIPPPPPVTNCTGGTVLWSLTPAGQTVNDNSSKDFTVPGFEISCGDTLQVFFRTAGITPAPAWTQLGDVDLGASYYSVVNQTVTFHNRTGIVLEIDIEAVLK